MKITSIDKRHDEEQVFFSVENILKFNKKRMITCLHYLLLFKCSYDKIMFNQQCFIKLLDRVYLVSIFELTHKNAAKNSLAN